MNNLSRALAMTLFVAAFPATIALAQDAEPAPPAEMKELKGPSPETMTRLEDGRIAMAKGALKLTPEQEKLWVPVEEQIRADYAAMRKAHEERRAKREARRESKKDKPKLTLPERVERNAERMTERAASMNERAATMNERAAKAKEFAEVLTPFYASLSDEQIEVANHLLRRFASGKMGRGHHGGRHGGKRMCGKGGGWGRHHGRSWN